MRMQEEDISQNSFSNTLSAIVSSLLCRLAYPMPCNFSSYNGPTCQPVLLVIVYFEDIFIFNSSLDIHVIPFSIIVFHPVPI